MHDPQIANRLDDFPGSSNAFNLSTCEVTEMPDAESFPVGVQSSDQFCQSTAAYRSQKRMPITYRGNQRVGS
jgi:hypothetical protein